MIDIGGAGEMLALFIAITIIVAGACIYAYRVGAGK